MSVDVEQQFELDSTDETNYGSIKKPRISYKREFLLSLSNLDVCKKLPKLPNGFDELLLRESEDPLPDRRRTSGDFSSHGFRRNDYSSSPPTRGELGNYSRGTHGRWEGRSGVWNDKDSDSQSDRDSEPGRRYGPSRRPWQAPEHDGLLGKGSFPRPSGFGVGTSAPKSQSNDSYHLSRSNEPYHPPRPYKASPYTRRDVKDTFNDETFGSSDSTSEDRAEEERKRRASFELLRKEQHKAFQERQKLNPEGRKNDFDFTELLGDSKDEKVQSDRSNQVIESSTLPSSNNAVALLQNTTARPLVPPGFASTLLERKQVAKPPTGVFQHEGSLLNSKDGHLVNGMSGNNEKKPSTKQMGSNELLMKNPDVVISSNTSESERAVDLSTVLGRTSDTFGKDKSSVKVSCISTTEASGSSEQSVQSTMNLDQKGSLGNSDGPSILDKLFNTALDLNDGESSNFIEQRDNKVEEILSPQRVKSSKFAYLFLEEDNKLLEDISSNEQPSGLLSLLQAANKSQSFDVKSKDEHLVRLPIKKPDQLSNSSPSKSAAGPPVLTCEDLEQSILSEVSDSYSLPPPAVQDSDISSMRTKQQKTYVDDHASQHLLSLLQRGAGSEIQVSQLTSNTESRPPAEKPPRISGVNREAETGNSQNSGKSLTLETLFGSAFMNELQSVGEPVDGLPLPIKDEGLLRAGAYPGLDGSINELTQRDKMRSDDFSRIRAAGVGLPGEDNLLGVVDPLNVQKYMPFQEPEVPFNIAEKLAALNSGPRKERLPVGGSSFLGHPPQFTNGPDLPFQPSNTHPQLQPSHLNGSGPLYHSFDPRYGNVKSQIVHQDSPPNMIQSPYHQTPGGVPEFDRLPHPILQQMQMRGNIPHPHLLQGFPGGAPHHHPRHVNNQMPPELNTSHGFPFAHCPPNFAGHNMPPPVQEINRSDSLQRLMGMDPKHITAMGQVNDMHRQGSLGHGLDLNSAFR